jgi:hypothetical protein
MDMMLKRKKPTSGERREKEEHLGDQAEKLLNNIFNKCYVHV